MEYQTELLDYANAADGTFGWEVEKSERPVGNGGVIRLDIRLTSQTWRGFTWRHQLVLFIPGSPACADMCLLTMGADGPCPAAHEALGCKYAEQTGMPCAFLYDVPNQPLFDGRVEDALIAYTLIQRLDTGETDWPLLLPMTRSAVSAMNTIEEQLAVDRFVVTGASKRGWTTWLCAAADDRVVGIAPVVYDNLNLFAQMPHQMAVFDHQYSEQISDYADSGVLERMKTPAGYQLARLIDPFTYRSLVQQPKLIINGSNDPYWATDALTLYWSQLEGPHNVLYAPNQVHSINDPDRLDSTIIEFVVRCAQNTILPTLEQRVEDRDGHRNFSLSANEPIKSAACWAARSGTRDFRLSTWRPAALELSSGNEYTLKLARPAEGYVAAFCEAEFEGSTGAFTVSTPVSVFAG